MKIRIELKNSHGKIIAISEMENERMFIIPTIRYDVGDLIREMFNHHNHEIFSGLRDWYYAEIKLERNR